MDYGLCTQCLMHPWTIHPLTVYQCLLLKWMHACGIDDLGTLLQLQCRKCSQKVSSWMHKLLVRSVLLASLQGSLSTDKESTMPQPHLNSCTVTFVDPCPLNHLEEPSIS